MPDDLQFPEDLQARLNAAGVHDAASLDAALSADPSLRAEYDAFVAANQDSIRQQMLNAALQAFADVQNAEQLTQLWHQIPTELEEPFIQAIEEWLAQAETAGETTTAEGLNQRLVAIRELRAREAVQQSPLVQALISFVNAPDAATAQEIFSAQQGLLSSNEAQRLIDELFRSDDPEVQRQIETRREVLRDLRATVAPAAIDRFQLEPAVNGNGNGHADGAELEVERLFFTFLNARSLDDIQQILEANPVLLSPAVDPLFAALRQEHVGDTEALDVLNERQAIMAACRERGVAVVIGELSQKLSQQQPEVEEFEQALNNYLQQCTAASETEDDVAAWEAAAAAGEPLLMPPFSDTPGLNVDVLRANLADTYNMLGKAHSEQQNLAAALECFERAIDLQPTAAIWQRNRASILIELGQLDAASEAIAIARKLDPESPRLSSLDSSLAEARDQLN